MFSKLRVGLLLLGSSLVAAHDLEKYHRLLWSDEFNSGDIPFVGRWSYDIGDGTANGIPAGWGNGELQQYTSESKNVRVEGGNLVIEAHRMGDMFSSARIKTLNKMSFKYGTIRARISLPNMVGGLWPAFWTLGSANVAWPNQGEIDIMEGGWRGIDNKRIYSAAHWEHQGGLAMHDGFYDSPTDLNGTFHIYELVWNTTTIATYIDDQYMWHMDIGADKCTDCTEFHSLHHVMLNTAVGGGFTSDGSACGDSHGGSSGSSGGCRFRTAAEISNDFAESRMLVDWIRLYDTGATVLSIGGTPLGGAPVNPPLIPRVPTPPTPSPTAAPTQAPTPAPTGNPTVAPTPNPTGNPTAAPTPNPTSPPTPIPTGNPTVAPTPGPTRNPTQAPTGAPTLPPTPSPTMNPTMPPTLPPSVAPTPQPTAPPTMPPTPKPTLPPADSRTTLSPVGSVARTPTRVPTTPPTPEPTPQPVATTPAPTMNPTMPPTLPPTMPPTMPPTLPPTMPPTPAMVPPTVPPSLPPTPAPMVPPTVPPTMPPTVGPVTTSPVFREGPPVAAPTPAPVPIVTLSPLARQGDDDSCTGKGCVDGREQGKAKAGKRSSDGRKGSSGKSKGGKSGSLGREGGSGGKSKGGGKRTSVTSVEEIGSSARQFALLASFLVPLFVLF